MKKYLLRYGIITILVLIVIPLVPAFISSLRQTEITADIHKITTAPPPYLYKYEAATYDLFAGKKTGAPNFRLVQGKRNLDVTVITNQASKSSLAPKPERFGTSLKSRLFGQAVASEDVKIVNTDTKPAIEYTGGDKNAEFILEPDQEKVQLILEIGSAQASLPILKIASEKLVPRSSGEEIIFYTRTNREAFSLKNPTITDANEKSTEVIINIDQNEKLYIISFDLDASWLNTKSRSFPVTLTVDLVSLFHERMIAAVPLKADFAAVEKPQFTIDPSSADEPLKTALINRDYTNVKFGVINAAGQGHRVSAELLDSNGGLVLRFTGGDNFIKPGLYDLLVQYKDEPSFIGEEEFSWGVLAMNPDQAVYKPGSEAKIDMAILDELGRVTCDAKVYLEITDPAGGKINLSTTDKSIEITPGCSQNETDLPDYTTSYKTSISGEYLLKLTAVTKNGSYTITDKFSANPDSPFYVKRVGPTRIYPPKTYEMKLTIEANQNASKIVEILPQNFQVTKDPNFNISRSDVTVLIWDRSIRAGERLEISYQFKGPNISPALFFIGPLKIRSVNSEKIWQEPRVWQVAFDAIETLRPNATGTYQEWDLVDTTHYGATSDQNNATYLETGVDEERDIQNLDDTTFPASDTINSITIYITCKGFGSGAKEKVATLIREGGTDTEGGSTSTDRDNFVDISTIYTTNPRTAAAWQKSEIDALEAGARLKIIGGGETVQCSEIRVDVDHVASGPTNAQLLRHGTWFDAGVEQPMTF